MQKLVLKGTKVGFLGSSPSSHFLAPVNDPAWEIWACGPGAHMKPGFNERFNRWFELHDMEENDPQKHDAVLDHGYFAWLQSIVPEKTVYYRPPVYPGLSGDIIPWDEIRAEHSDYFLDSTISWMMAFCYEACDVDEVGLFGIDFATDAERRKQRKGAKHFIELFRHKGVKVTVPDVSELAFDPPPYPEVSQLYKKIQKHISLLDPDRVKTEKMIGELQNALDSRRRHLERVNGTLETLEYAQENWS